MSKQKRYVDTRFALLQEELDRRFNTVDRLLTEKENSLKLIDDAQEKAANLQRTLIETRLHDINEWKSFTLLQQEKLTTREELTTVIGRVNNLHEMYMKRLGDLEASTARIEGRMIAGGVGVAILSIAATIALHFIK